MKLLSAMVLGLSLLSASNALAYADPEDVARDGLSLCYKLPQQHCGWDSRICQWLDLPGHGEIPWEPAKPAFTGCMVNRAYKQKRIQEGTWHKLQAVTEMQCGSANKASNAKNLCNLMAGVCEWASMPAQPEQPYVPAQPPTRGCYPKPDLAAQFGLPMPGISYP